MMKPYAHPEVLVSTDWVSEHLNDESVAVIEVDADFEAGYGQGHVPGAIGWDLHVDLEDQVSRDIPGLSQLEGLLGRSGIGNDTTVVLYGDGNNRSATWAFWLLKYYRHGDVRLINGGRTKWTQESRPLSTEVPSPAPSAYRAGVPDRSIRATKNYVLRGLRDPSVALLDARTSEEYKGELAASIGTDQSGAYRKGRIPGAIHVQWDEGAGDDGTFRPVSELAALYQSVGATPDKEVVSYCRLGMRASYSWFILKYLLGYERVRTYDGSWTEWGNSVGVPVESDAG